MDFEITEIVLKSKTGKSFTFDPKLKELS